MHWRATCTIYCEAGRFTCSALLPNRYQLKIKMLVRKVVACDDYFSTSENFPSTCSAFEPSKLSSQRSHDVLNTLRGVDVQKRGMLHFPLSDGSRISSTKLLRNEHFKRTKWTSCTHCYRLYARSEVHLRVHVANDDHLTHR